MLKIKSLLLSVILLFPVGAIAYSTNFNIKVESDWGNANPKDVLAVLNSASSIITAYTGGRTLDDIIVKNNKNGPISLYERGRNGEYVVLLDINGRYWSQLAYQFTHEACHLLSNYDLAPNNVTKQQWFEESICEAFSLFILERMAEQWTEDAPYANWKSYAPEIQKYVNHMRRQEHRSFAPNLVTWYQANRATLEDNPYAKDRMLNEKIAAHLLKLMEKRPTHWAVLNYLNLGDETGDKSFKKYLNDWLKNTPEEYQQTVVDIQQLLGISNPLHTANN